MEATSQGSRDNHIRHAEKRTDMRGRDYYWMGFDVTPSRPEPGTDIQGMYDGKITVTPLHIDMTHRETLRRLKGELGGPPPSFSPEKFRAS